MQLTKTFLPNSAIFIEKKWVKNRFWGKRAFFGGEKCIMGLEKLTRGVPIRGPRTDLSPRTGAGGGPCLQAYRCDSLPLRQLARCTRGGLPGRTVRGNIAAVSDGPTAISSESTTAPLTLQQIEQVYNRASLQQPSGKRGMQPSTATLRQIYRVSDGLQRL